MNHKKLSFTKTQFYIEIVQSSGLTNNMLWYTAVKIFTHFFHIACQGNYYFYVATFEIF